MGSPETPAALAQAEASVGTADRRRLSRAESCDDFTRDALDALGAIEAHASSSANDHIALMVRLGETLAKARDRVGHGKFKRWSPPQSRIADAVEGEGAAFEAADLATSRST